MLCPWLVAAPPQPHPSSWLNPDHRDDHQKSERHTHIHHLSTNKPAKKSNKGIRELYGLNFMTPWVLSLWNHKKKHLPFLLILWISVGPLCMTFYVYFSGEMSQIHIHSIWSFSGEPTKKKFLQKISNPLHLFLNFIYTISRLSHTWHSCVFMSIASVVLLSAS